MATQHLTKNCPFYLYKSQVPVHMALAEPEFGAGAGFEIRKQNLAGAEIKYLHSATLGYQGPRGFHPGVID